jgi:L-cysteate sulfo-lyase
MNRFPRFEIGAFPTPLQRLQSLKAALQSEGCQVPDIWIKRDDLTGLALGGNKVRKLEFLLADASSQGCDVLITCGAAQSNHALQTAAAGKRFGFRTVCVLDGPAPNGPPTGNLLLHHLLGSTIVWCAMQEPETRKEQARRRVMRELSQKLESEGSRPYTIPTGGSTWMGSLGYIKAVEELLGQLNGVEIEAAYFASGSGGTHAGIVVGAQQFGWQATLNGVDVDYIPPDSRGERPFWRAIERLTRETAEMSGSGIAVPSEQIVLRSEFAGPAYGTPTAESEEALRMLAATEGIFLDPVYTAKAFSALLADVRSNRYSPDSAILFWHTGGTAGLFAPH